MTIPVWCDPIEIHVGMGTRSVRGPFDALIHLAEHWPRRTGSRFIRAGIACKAALAGRLDVEEARRDFLEAAKEADVYLH